ncbi:MAG: GGDEF domain-containing protein [Ruminococcus sp.]|nr:GGDEF domain-containing protein [Ruminococcus sp.]
MSRPVEIAVIVAGINEEYQNALLEGIISFAKSHNVNISCFSPIGGVISVSKYDIGEYNIFSLINFDLFDGVIMMTNTISAPEEKEKLIKRVKESKLPAVVFDSRDTAGFYNIRIDNRSAMRAIVEHVINEHGAKKINYISGPLTNPEAEARYNAYLDVMAEHELPVDTRRIYFGEFRSQDGKNAARAFHKSRLSKPDAVICANDNMALSAMEEFRALGYKIPEDIIITGFDNTFDARHHSPSLTTVDRPLGEEGYRACQLIIDDIEGKPCENEIVLQAAPIFAQSCGCQKESEENTLEYQQDIYKRLNDCRYDINVLNRLTTDLADNDTLDDVIDDIKRYVSELHLNGFSLCLCSNWDESLRDGWKMYTSGVPLIHGYTEKMTAPLIIDGNRTFSAESFSTSAMYPYRDGSSHNISYFLPLHFREICLGYYIISNSRFPLKSMLAHAITLNISHSIENIRKLLNLNRMINELDKLYVNDPLCNIYNRNGFIRAADAVFNHCKRSGEKMLISFIDMDGLKIINDNYGHKEGDFALQRLAYIISDCCEKNYICARFGGDEFIILGSGVHDGDIELLESNFKKQLESVNLAVNKPYKLSASIGSIMSEVTDDVKLFSLITQADELMYNKKKKKATSRYLRRD